MLGVRQPGYNPSCAASQYDQGRLFSVSSLEKDLKKKKKSIPPSQSMTWTQVILLV